MIQPLLAPGAIVTVIRCSVGGPSECRDASASLTFGTDFSGLRTRIDVRFATLHQARCTSCSVSNRLLIRVRVLEKSVPKVKNTEKRYVRTGYWSTHACTSPTAAGAACSPLRRWIPGFALGPPDCSFLETGWLVAGWLFRGSFTIQFPRNTALTHFPPAGRIDRVPLF